MTDFLGHMCIVHSHEQFSVRVCKNHVQFAFTTLNFPSVTVALPNSFSTFPVLASWSHLTFLPHFPHSSLSRRQENSVCPPLSSATKHVYVTPQDE